MFLFTIGEVDSFQHNQLLLNSAFLGQDLGIHLNVKRCLVITAVYSKNTLVFLVVVRVNMQEWNHIEVTYHGMAGLLILEKVAYGLPLLV